MANDATLAMFTGGCQCLYGTFKAVKKMRVPIFDDLETFVVPISTSLACLHISGALYKLSSGEAVRDSNNLDRESKCCG